MQLTPKEIVKELALGKAENVAADLVDARRDLVIIGADTIVVQDGEILGKPEDEEHAFRMLQSLRGREHQVYTGVALIVQNPLERKEIVFAEKTKVFVYPMTKDEILSYRSFAAGTRQGRSILWD